MAPGNLVTSHRATQEVRARLLGALHVGRLRTGERVLSVRKLADMIGVNHKTVHRVYTELAREGILEVRPGSGTFVSERRTAAREAPPGPSLLAALDRLRSEADRLGVEPGVLSRFVQIALGDGWREQRLGLIECNGEQIAMIARELQQAIGVEVVPLFLSRLERDPSVLAGLSRVVTTDCHYGQVKALLQPTGIQIYTVALDPGFPRFLLRLAARDEVLLVIGDRRFGPVFLRLLTQLAADRTVLRRVHVVQAERAAAVFRSAPRGAWVYFSPLVPPAVCRRVPEHLRRVQRCWRLDATTLDSLRACLAFEQATRHAV